MRQHLKVEVCKGVSRHSIPKGIKVFLSKTKDLVQELLLKLLDYLQSANPQVPQSVVADGRWVMYSGGEVT